MNYRLSLSDDYAVQDMGNLTLYYGYEYSYDKRIYAERPDEDIWGFYLEDNVSNKIIVHITFDDLCKQMKLDKLDCFETAECLLAFWAWLYKNQEFLFIGVSGT